MEILEQLSPVTWFQVTGRCSRPIKTHNGLIAKFGQEVVVAGHLPADHGQDLNNVQKFRLVADYSADSVDLADAAWSVERAEAFVATVKKKFHLGVIQRGGTLAALGMTADESAMLPAVKDDPVFRREGLSARP